MSEGRITNEHVERISFGFSLTTASLALHKDHLINQSKEDRFLITGLKLAGRPATTLAAQRSSGRHVMSLLLEKVFPASERPKVVDCFVVGPNQFRSESNLPPLIFLFGDPIIAKEVRYRLLRHAKETPALESVYVEPVLTLATRVRIQILFAIKTCLASKATISYVRRYERSPSLVVTHDQREKRYDFVQACVSFRHLLTPDSLRSAYGAARRDFLEQLTSLFIVFTDGEQPLTTFTVAATNHPISQAGPSGSVLPAATIQPVARPNFLLSSLANPRKRPNDSAPLSTPTKRVAS